MADVPWYYRNLAQTRAAILAGEVSAEHLTEDYAARIDRLQPTLAPFARLRHEQALAEARALDAAFAAGATPGPLHGVPIAIKDLLNLRGELVASGTTVMAQRHAEFDATVVARLRVAGAVLIGQTQLTEGAFGLHHPALTAPRNPWEKERWPGVSSSGSGVAVAAGLAVGALGTDTGGSIRFPAACCGLVGLKPTYGRVSVHGAWALGPSLDHIGPMTRSVADAALLLEVLSGADPADPRCLAQPAPAYSALPPLTDLRGIRIGFDVEYAARGVEGAVTARLQAVRSLLEDLGAQLVPITMPDNTRELVAAWSESCGYECARVHSELYPARAAEYGPALRSLIEIGRQTSTARYQAIEQSRVRFTRQFEAAFEAMDLLLIPSLPRTVPLASVAEGSVAEDNGRADYLTFTAPFDYSGHPTLSLPTGLEAADQGAGPALPHSLQLVAALQREDRLVQAGLVVERAVNEVFGGLYRQDRYPPAAHDHRRHSVEPGEHS